MRYSAPSAHGGQELNLDRGRSKFSKNSKGINHLKVLQEIADKWVDKGYYNSQGRALEALLGGRL